MMRPQRTETKVGLQRQRNLWLSAAGLVVFVVFPSTCSYHGRTKTPSRWAERSPQWAGGPLLSSRARRGGQQNCKGRLQADLAFPHFSLDVVRVQNNISGFLLVRRRLNNDFDHGTRRGSSNLNSGPTLALTPALRFARSSSSFECYACGESLPHAPAAGIS